MFSVMGFVDCLLSQREAFVKRFKSNIQLKTNKKLFLDNLVFFAKILRGKHSKTLKIS